MVDVYYWKGSVFLINPGDQTVEYAISTSTTTPITGWQNQTTFTGLSDDTVYFLFARSAANSNWNEGTESQHIGKHINESRDTSDCMEWS